MLIFFLHCEVKHIAFHTKDNTYKTFDQKHSIY